jgi:hypothetical protein
MTTLLVLYDTDGWGYHSRAQAIARHAPADFEVRLASYDPLTAAERLESTLGDPPPDIVFVLCHHVLKHVCRVTPAVTRRCQDRRSDRTVAFFRTTAAVRRKLSMWRVQLSRRGSIE